MPPCRRSSSPPFPVSQFHASSPSRRSPLVPPLAYSTFLIASSPSFSAGSSATFTGSDRYSYGDGVDADPAVHDVEGAPGRPPWIMSLPSYPESVSGTNSPGVRAYPPPLPISVSSPSWPHSVSCRGHRRPEGPCRAADDALDVGADHVGLADLAVVLFAVEADADRVPGILVVGEVDAADVRAAPEGVGALAALEVVGAGPRRSGSRLRRGRAGGRPPRRPRGRSPSRCRRGCLPGRWCCCPGRLRRRRGCSRSRRTIRRWPCRRARRPPGSWRA